MGRAVKAIATDLFVVAMVGFIVGCTSVEPPVVDPHVRALADRPVVIFVPGLTGSVLHDETSGRVTWGDFRSFFVPRDYGYAMALPIGTAPDHIEAGGPISEISFLLYRKDVYGPIVTTFEANGYEKGVDLVLFGYDWRRSNVTSARALARLIDDLGARGVEHVVLICQSNGGYLCRWAARFGDVSLEEVENGVVRPPRTNVDKLVLLGTANHGSIRILREIDRGRTYVSFGRFLGPEGFFTYESLYQDLPPYRDDLFVDQYGRVLDVDLYDAANWVRYGWSIFGDEATRRADARMDLFGDRTARLTFLQRQLDVAYRFHQALEQGPPPREALRYYSIQSRSEGTMYRAMLVPDGDQWRTLFMGDRGIDRAIERRFLMAVSGDGHASIQSQEALNEAELRRLAQPVIEVGGNHLSVVTGTESLRAILEILGE